MDKSGKLQSLQSYRVMKFLLSYCHNSFGLYIKMKPITLFIVHGANRLTIGAFKHLIYICL